MALTVKTIELKNIKHSEFASQETNCYEATVYVNGERAFTARNEGHGGCDFYWALTDKEHNPIPRSEELLKAAQDYCKSLPPHVYEGYERYECPTDLETVIGDLLENYLKAKDHKRLTQNGKRTAFSIPSEPDVVRTVLAPICDKVKAFIVSKYGEGCTFINEQPVPQPIHISVGV